MMVVTDEMIRVGIDAANAKYLENMVEDDNAFDDAIKAGITAALSALPAGVKPLEWKQTVIGDGTVLRQNAWLSGHYHIVESPSGKYDLRGDTYAICDTLEAAKAAAQADYSARILSAIYPAGVETPAPKSGEALRMDFLAKLIRCRKVVDAEGLSPEVLEALAEALEAASGIVEAVLRTPAHTTRFRADINNVGDGWVQVTVTGEGAAALSEGQIEQALSEAFRQTETPAPTPDDWWAKELRGLWGDSNHAVTLDTRRAAKVALDFVFPTLPVNPTQEGKDNG